jgi:hypothetical protein
MYQQGILDLTYYSIALINKELLVNIQHFQKNANSQERAVHRGSM